MAAKSESKARKNARAPRRAAPPAPKVDGTPSDAPNSEPGSSAAKRLLRAGIKALGDVPGDVLARQSRIFEVLLGIGQSPGWPGAGHERVKDAAADPFGKFEHVFDERVARSLARLGMPPPQALRELCERVEQLTAALAKAETTRRKR